MKRKVKHYPDELKLKLFQEYLTIEQGKKELMEKYNFSGKYECQLIFNINNQV